MSQHTVEIKSIQLVEATNIHSTVPERYNPQGGFTYAFDEKREKVLTYLMGKERRGQWRTAYKIAIECGLPVEGTQAIVRKYVKEINHYAAERGLHFAIVSSNAGFMYVDDPEMVKTSILHHRARRNGLLRTIEDETTIYLRLGGTLEQLNYAKYDEEVL